MNRLSFLFLTASAILSIFGTCQDIGVTPDNWPDTTSHDFTWTMTILGDGGGSILYDVAIVNDTLAYAVGEIYLRDSTGRIDPKKCNLAVWNGHAWEIIRLNFQGSPPVIHSIFAFDKNDIWFDPWFHWNGQEFQEIPVDPLFYGIGISKMWGSTKGELYVVGRNGGIFYSPSNGASWQSLSSGTDLPINDIWGAWDERTRQWEILAIASNTFSNQGSALFRISGSSVNAVPDSGLSWNLAAVWFIPGRKYYVVGAGIHYKNTLDDSPWRLYPSGEVTTYYSGAVRGNGWNDVFVVGSFFEVVHFNGSSWMRYGDLFAGDGALGSVTLRHNLAIAVGGKGTKAVALVGRR